MESGLRNESFDEYLAVNALSSHGIITLTQKSPQHFKYQFIDGHLPHRTKAMEFGAALHLAVLEPEVFESRCRVKPAVDRRTKAGKAEYAAWEEDLPRDAVILSEEDFFSIDAMRSSVFSHGTAKRLLQGGIPEISGYWERDKIPCKCRPDYIHRTDRIIIDLKTTTDASSKAFQRQIINYGYDIQAAWYRTAFKYIVGKEAEAYLWVCIEKDPPYATAVYRADETVIGRGESLCDKGFEVFKHCLENNDWPGYQTKAEDIGVPPWAMWELYDE